jgi:hypothetical protein
LKNSLITAILAVLVAHLLATWHERATELRRMRTQAARMATLLLNEVAGLRVNLLDKYYFITAHWDAVRHAATGTYEASAIDIASLELTGDRLTQTTELSERPIDLFCTALRRIKIMLNEYAEPAAEFTAPAMRGMLALRLYNVCTVEKTLAELEDTLRHEKARLAHLMRPGWRRLFTQPPAAPAAGPASCNVCGLCGAAINRAKFLANEDHHHEDYHLIDKSGALRPADSLLCRAPMLRELAGTEISGNALKGLKENPVAPSKIQAS